MASDVKKIQLGPAIVEYGDAADKVLFETTIGGIVLTMETSYREQRIDQEGETIVSKVVTGRNVSVEVPFAETDLEKIPKFMVGAKLIKASTGTKQKVEISTAVGVNLIDNAKKVVIKPVAYLTDASKWATIPLAYPETDLQYNYDNENERITNVTLRATPNVDRVVLILGDETTTATP
ncbi:hypothetical protein NQ117_05260 [Paenibacillus sp. SC116]|uniref:hypothetical protein n=1 Tax=Paenibacillus sp. SC116 TaxID=2968986 RepID=UPI00215B65EE|nr:hypothetical protein [Paenibacillus sp. SC116]MCR8843080.1 hypothetical protein [Paenibacillus sp. SC116]